MVLMDQSAQNLTSSDDPPGRPFGGQSGIGRRKVQAPMRPGPVVMTGVRPEDALQVAWTEEEDVIEALSPDRADPTLRERVRPRRPNGCLHHRDPFRAEDLFEGAGEPGVSIPEQDVLVLQASGDREVSGVLGDPGGVGPAGCARKVDLSRGELDE